MSDMNQIPDNFSKEEYTDYLALFILLYIVKDEARVEKLWKDFVAEIKTRSRFFPKSALLDEVKELITYATNIVKAGSKFFRARAFNSPLEYAENELDKLLPEMQQKFPDLNLTTEDMHNNSFILLLGLLSNICENESEVINRKITEFKGKNCKFYGYDADGSDAPALQENITDGRANAKGIRFLYASNDTKTAIMEIGAKIGQPVSVAEIEILRDINVFDLSSFHEDEVTKGMTLGALSVLFSLPNYRDELEYLPTQYLCEYIRELGFDGICFFSSLDPEHKNLVIFDTCSSTKPYTILGSEVYEVKKIEVQYDKLLPKA